MQIVIKELDKTRIRYEAMVWRLGERDAALAASRAMNHEGRKALTAVRRTLVKQTSIRRSLIVKGVTFEAARPNSLRFVIKGQGSELPLRLFGARQFSYGVKAKVWGRQQVYKSNFIVSSEGGDVFHREGPKRIPIGRTFGPSIAKELVKDETVEAFNRKTDDIADRVMHELRQLLRVR